MYILATMVTKELIKKAGRNFIVDVAKADAKSVTAVIIFCGNSEIRLVTESFVPSGKLLVSVFIVSPADFKRFSK